MHSFLIKGFSISVGSAFPLVLPRSPQHTPLRRTATQVPSSKHPFSAFT